MAVLQVKTLLFRRDKACLVRLSVSPYSVYFVGLFKDEGVLGMDRARRVLCGCAKPPCGTVVNLLLCFTLNSVLLLSLHPSLAYLYIANSAPPSRAAAENAPFAKAVVRSRLVAAFVSFQWRFSAFPPFQFASQRHPRSFPPAAPAANINRRDKASLSSLALSSYLFSLCTRCLGG
jgi:hypothetical protein